MSAASSQRTIPSSRKSSASATSASATSLAGRGLDLGVPLHDLDRVPAVHLQDLVDVDAGNLQGDEHLDHELVAWGRDEVGRGAKPIRRSRSPTDVIQ